MDSDNLGPAVLAVAWTLAAVATLVVAARLYVRLRIVRTLNADDYIILLTLLLGYGDSIFVTISTTWGLGQHVAVLRAHPERIMYTVKWVYLCEFFSIMCPGFGRISFAFLLLSIIPPSTGRKLFLWGVIAAQFIVDVGTVIVSFSQCRPINGFWDKSIEADCWSPSIQQDVGFAQSAVCSMVDLVLALFPATLFWDLNMELKQKIALSVLMGLGIFAMVASIIKTVGLQALTETEDLTYSMGHLAIFWTLEAYLVLIAASMPTLKPILRPRRARTQDESGYRTGQSSWSHSQRARMSKNDRASQLATLSDPSSGEDIDLRLWVPPSGTCTYEASAEFRRSESRRNLVGDGIRRDVTVRVEIDGGSRIDDNHGKELDVVV